MKNIPIYSPYLHGNEKKYVNDCLDSTWISSKGKYIELFEKNFADYIGAEYAVGVSNGTVALHLALETLGIKRGDEVIVPTFTYIASVNSIIYTGATPVFADSDKESWQISPEAIKKKITPQTKAIMAVHLYGQACAMDEILEIAREHNLYVIEDCAEAFGSKYKNKFVGTLGHISCFSFFGNKTITTGEGGMVATSDEILKERASHLKGQGLSKNREYWHDTVAYNYRITNICAAIGVAQLEVADAIIGIKRDIAGMYRKELQGLPLTLQGEMPDTVNTYWMIVAMLDDAGKRDELREFLRAANIETRPAFYPIHTMPMFNEDCESFPVAEELAGRGINLPSHPDLTSDEIKFIAQKIGEFYNL